MNKSDNNKSDKELRKKIDDAIRFHYWKCKCGKDATYLEHCETILKDVMKIIDYKPRVEMKIL
ncbi:MAG: hypothetical protein ABI340_04070 [Nitrososphaera sp.]